jgi:hypothetical protein
MTEQPPIEPDEHGTNNKVGAKKPGKDHFARIECAQMRKAIVLSSPHMQRLYRRYFESMELQTHFVSVIARTRLPHRVVDKVERNLRRRLQKRKVEIDQMIDHVQAAMNANGISTIAPSDGEPLHFEARVISSMGRRYLELIGKVDQLFGMLQTLANNDIITPQELGCRQAMLKSAVKGEARAARKSANILSEQCHEPSAHAMDERDGGSAEGSRFLRAAADRVSDRRSSG